MSIGSGIHRGDECRKELHVCNGRGDLKGRMKNDAVTKEECGFFVPQTHRESRKYACVEGKVHEHV